MNLIIVESPTKSKTLGGFLGKNYKILSSYGHIRDLPKSELGVDVEKNFEPKYIIPTKARKNLNVLKKEVKKTDSVILATDEDREGEAIAWHLMKALDLKDNYQRIVFHEITKGAIEDALKKPRKIDLNLVDAQQARRILDRIVGYKLSPFLWKKIARGLSAGRVQSIAVRLVAEREREIEKFKAQEYWSIEALLKKLKEEKQFSASLIKKNDKAIPKLGLETEKEAQEIVKKLEKAEYKISEIEKKEVRRNPLPPFITSTLQQDAWKRFHFTAKSTMRAAQRLYETGLITYHRTDSLNLSSLALGTSKDFITKNFGQKYHQFRKFKTKSKGAQEAHEAIRPTYVDKTPESLKLDIAQSKLYTLIWQRFVASQMKEALFDATTIDIEAKNFTFRSTGQILKFDGFLKIYPIKFEEKELPKLEKEEVLNLVKLTPDQHFTQPLPRYTEASLIKALESEGIGRPSTYAPIISTIQSRNYIEKNQNHYFQPTEIGLVVNDLLVEHFPEIVNIKFTANMEEDLDNIAHGKKDWHKVMKEFYTPFSETLQKKYEAVSKKEFTDQPTNKKCPKCESDLIVKLGKFGKFLACSNFPKCRYTESLAENALNIKCPKCQEGNLVEKRTKKNKIFYGCNRFPKCDFALWDKPTGETCSECGSLMVEKNKKIKCSNKECKNN
ncbi:MAG: type I DNA topoisomerase, partial [Candidatus Nealsonbacteria bacterium]